KFRPEDGMKVTLRGKVSLYEKDGTYQLYAEEMIPDGVGDVALAFEQIKEKLQSEGLFDAESKRDLPVFPRKIAVVTSESGAAVRDIINVLSRRWPIAEIIMCPVAVQGELAVPSMCDALDRIYTLAVADVIIIGRGGGSIEDLWAFNSEILARKIYESPIPVISAVGHETDFTICDFVADLRAPTPSAAAELAVPDISEVMAKIGQYELSLKSKLANAYNVSLARFSGIINSYYFKNPDEALIERKSQSVDKLRERIADLMSEKMQKSENRLMNNLARLDALSPLKILSRGYAAVTDAKGDTVNSVSELGEGDALNLRMIDGQIECKVTKIKI
ncbi:MAG: exodeoxyribonuclease VII large subunit, partial [Clostridia bacterium]|nr:exodeoxyribonuclease VII large subunit [Clostridia bacterium]